MIAFDHQKSYPSLRCCLDKSVLTGNKGTFLLYLKMRPNSKIQFQILPRLAKILLNKYENLLA
jgi:hypothetical protein